MTFKDAKTIKQMFPDKWLEALYAVSTGNTAPGKGWEKITTEELARLVDNYETKTI